MWSQKALFRSPPTFWTSTSGPSSPQFSGAVRFLRLGTPCSSYSMARSVQIKGPRPLRSKKHILGLPNLSACSRMGPSNAREHAHRLLEAALTVMNQRGDFSAREPRDQPYLADASIEYLQILRQTCSVYARISVSLDRCTLSLLLCSARCPPWKSSAIAVLEVTDMLLSCCSEG